MEVKATFERRHNGTRQLLKQHGGRLTHILYRNCKTRWKHLKSREITIVEQGWTSVDIPPAREKLSLKTCFNVMELREQLKWSVVCWSLDPCLSTGAALQRAEYSSEFGFIVPIYRYIIGTYGNYASKYRNIFYI